MGRTHITWSRCLLALACVGCSVPGRGGHRSALSARTAATAPSPAAETAMPARHLGLATAPVAPPVVAASVVPLPPVVHTIEPAADLRTLEVVVGQELVFVNHDGICHGFFSSSAQNGFDVGVLQPRERASVRFVQPGTVHVYCCLHQHRPLTIQVVPSAPVR